MILTTRRWWRLAHGDPSTDPEGKAMIPTDLATLSELIMSEPSPAPKPDLFDRLAAQEGYERAGSLWGNACQWNDTQVRASAIDSLKTLLRQDPPDLEQARREARAAMSLSHYELSRPWAAVVDALDAARDGSAALDCAAVVVEVERLDELETLADTHWRP